MRKPHPEILKVQLAVWVAGGGRVAAWCREHGINRGLAYDWYGAPWFQQLVQTHRRRAVDRAIGQMERSFSKAVETVVRLVDKGANDAVKLAASQALIDMLLGVSSQAQLLAELRRLARQVAELEQAARRARMS
jgi:hypothetical protein